MARKVTMVESNIIALTHKNSDLLLNCEEGVFDNNVITKQQFDVLVSMLFITEVNKDPITITDLVPLLERSLNSVSSIVNRMEKSGLVEKKWDMNDRRSARLSITPKGEKILKEAAIPNAELIMRLFANFSKADLKRFLSFLELFRNNLKEELRLKEIKADKESLNSQKMSHFLKILSG
jgi:MarR family transcriptional regulator, organic hydroperoxide resistance regulator